MTDIERECRAALDGAEHWHRVGVMAPRVSGITGTLALMVIVCLAGGAAAVVVGAICRNPDLFGFGFVFATIAVVLSVQVIADARHALRFVAEVNRRK